MKMYFLKLKKIHLKLNLFTLNNQKLCNENLYFAK